MPDPRLLSVSERVAASDAAATSWSNAAGTESQVVRVIADIGIHVRMVLKDPGTDAATNAYAFLPANVEIELAIDAASKLSFLGKAATTSGFVWITVVK
jgi:hypothetical protein